MTRTEEGLRAALTAQETAAPRSETVLAGVRRGIVVRRRRSRLATGAAVAMILLAGAAAVPLSLRRDLSSAAPPATSCTATALPILAGLSSPRLPHINVNAMDGSGRYIVASTHDENNGAYTVMVWDQGQPSVLPPLAANLLPSAVNSHGVIAGAASTGPPDPTALTALPAIYSTGGLTMLALPAGYTHGVATDINDTGDVVGSATNAKSETVAVLWPAAAPGTVRLLAASGNAAALSIAADGTVVGAADTAAGTNDRPVLRRPYAWDADGQGRELPLPAGYPGGMAWQIRGDWAAGYAVTSFGAPTTSQGATGVRVIWNMSTGAMTSFEPPETVLPVAVNARGDMASGASLVHDGHTFTLPAPDGGTATAVAIDSTGTILAGRANDRLSATPVIVWHC
jgi:uncharacterized membrane protein